MSGSIVILGVFVADTAYRAPRQPKLGETVLGTDFKLGPGGKGSNQAVAAARLGGEVCFISRTGADAFADLAERTWAEAGVTPAIVRDSASYTGAAYIFVEEASGDNAIIIAPGAAARLGPADIDAHAEVIRSASHFVTQLEQPLPAARRGLEIARLAGVTTILNPAPACPLDDELLALCDYITPNESEAEALTGVAVACEDDARRAAGRLLKRGVGGVIVTRGEAGALFHTAERSVHVDAFEVGPVVETTGAGDAFNGGFATALARGDDPVDAVRFASAVAGLSVTRSGAAPSMPGLAEVDKLLASKCR